MVNSVESDLDTDSTKHYIFVRYIIAQSVELWAKTYEMPGSIPEFAIIFILGSDPIQPVLSLRKRKATVTV